jgi:hypothetical protein
MSESWTPSRDGAIPDCRSPTLSLSTFYTFYSTVLYGIQYSASVPVRYSTKQLGKAKMSKTLSSLLLFGIISTATSRRNAPPRSIVAPRSHPRSSAIAREINSWPDFTPANHGDPVVRPIDYGADPTGLTDSTAAFQVSHSNAVFLSKDYMPVVTVKSSTVGRSRCMFIS